MNRKSISWTVAIIIACILIYICIQLFPSTNQEELRYRCYYIRGTSDLCDSGAQIRENATYEECEDLRLVGEKYANECNTPLFEWNINEYK